MKKQVRKALRLPLALVKQIESIAERDGATFSQFVRTAAIREVDRRKQAV